MLFESDDNNNFQQYDQSSSKMNVMGISMSTLYVEGFKSNPNRSKCGVISFYLGKSDDKGTPIAQVKSAYNTLYKQFKAKYGEPANSIEKAESGGQKSDYSKYYWVEWDIPSTGKVWLCWGKDLWTQQGYNNCILSVSHPDQSK